MPMTVQALVSDKWLLLGAEADETKTPIHGMKLVFHAEPDGLRGSLVKWITGDRVPLAGLHFDGSTLELQMTPDENTGKNPTLSLKLAGEQFEGYWMNSTDDKPMGPKLKLVRHRVS